MPSQAISGVGTKFYRWNGSSYGLMAEITSIKGPGMKRDTIDVTSLSSTSGYKEFIAGFREAGAVSLSMLFRQAQWALMKADFESDIMGYYLIVLPDAVQSYFEFEGLVTELPISITTKDAVSADVTIQVSGQVQTGVGANSSGNPSVHWS